MIAQVASSIPALTWPWPHTVRPGGERRRIEAAQAAGPAALAQVRARSYLWLGLADALGLYRSGRLSGLKRAASRPGRRTRGAGCPSVRGGGWLPTSALAALLGTWRVCGCVIVGTFGWADPAARVATRNPPSTRTQAPHGGARAARRPAIGRPRGGRISRKAAKKCASLPSPTQTLRRNPKSPGSRAEPLAPRLRDTKATPRATLAPPKVSISHLPSFRTHQGTARPKSPAPRALSAAHGAVRRVGMRASGCSYGSASSSCHRRPSWPGP